MNFVIYNRLDGSIQSYGYCGSIDQVLPHETADVGVIEVGPDVNAEDYWVVNGQAVLKPAK